MRHHLAKKAGSFGGAVGLVVAAMAVRASAQGLQAQLLTNPGFESPSDTTGANTDTTATGWSFYGSCVRGNFDNHTPGGEWSVWEQTFQSYGGIYQNVGDITDDTTYSLTCYYYFESAEPTVPGEVSDLALTFLNAGGSAVGTTDSNGFSDATYIPSSSVTATGQWLEYTVTGLAPSGATQVQVSFDFSGGSTVTGQQAAFVDDADLSGDGMAVLNAQWAVNGSGNWNSSGNWTTGSIPNAVGAEADFYGVITSGPQTVYTNSAITEGTLHFNNANEYVIAGAPTLTLEASAGNALVEVDQGTDELDLPLDIASNTTFNVAGGATLLVANPVTINSGETLSQSGTGTVTYQSIITVDSDAEIEFANSTHAHELSLASGAIASVGGSASTVLEVDSLANSGTLNLHNNTLIVNYGSSADPAATIRAYLAAGYNGGAWNGTSATSGVIVTSAPITIGAGTYSIGYADGADGVVAGLPSGEIEVAYTLAGDANLDGKVDSADFGILADNYGASARRLG